MIPIPFTFSFHTNFNFNFNFKNRHGNLSPIEQKSVFEVARKGELKIVVSTNVAEASVTLLLVLYFFPSSVFLFCFPFFLKIFCLSTLRSPPLLFFPLSSPSLLPCSSLSSILFSSPSSSFLSSFDSSLPSPLLSFFPLYSSLFSTFFIFFFSCLRLLTVGEDER